jgi:glycosyltransferase involved in cell wall biosynthesis
MKVTYITVTFPVLSETFACTDIRALQRAGVDVTVHTLRAATVHANDLLKERGLLGLHVTYGAARAVIEGIGVCLKRPMLTARLFAWLVATNWNRPRQLLLSVAVVPRSMGILVTLEREQPDVVHLFWGHYPSIVGFLVKVRLPRTVLSLFLGAYDLTQSFGGSAWVARRADVVSTHAKWNLAAIEALGVPRERIHLAYRGIDSASFKGHVTDKTPRRIVSVGRLDDMKGMDDVLRVFREIHATWPEATLHILGDGPERAKLDRLSRVMGIDCAVTFLGHLPQAEVAREVENAEVFLFMSWDYRERLPNVVKEAMASRCACVVTQTFGIEELVQDGVNGFVVPPRDIEMAVARVGAVFRGHVDMASVTAAAAEHIARFFTASRSMRSYLDRWQDVITRRHLPSLSVPSAQSASA